MSLKTVAKSVIALLCVLSLILIAPFTLAQHVQVEREQFYVKEAVQEPVSALNTKLFAHLAWVKGSEVWTTSSITSQPVNSSFRLINPITGEPLVSPKASSGYYNRTIVVTLMGKPFDYLGDIIEINVSGLQSSEKVIISLVGSISVDIYDGVAGEDGTLFLRLTIPSVPKGIYSVKAYLPERGYDITIPWSENPEVTSFEVYPKIVVTRLDSNEVPIGIGSIAVKVYGSGFGANMGRFVVLLNETDAIAAVNYHTYTLWRTNTLGLLESVGGLQTAIVIPVLEPGVYAITIYAEDYYTVGTGYVYIVNNLANIATKEHIDDVTNMLIQVSSLLNEALISLNSIEYTLNEVSFTVMTILDNQLYLITILEELKDVVATKEDIIAIFEYLEVLEFRIDDLYATMIDLYEQLNSRLVDLEMYLATLILDIENTLLNRTYELEHLIVQLHALVLELRDDIINEIYGLETQLEEVIDVIFRVHDSLQSRIDQLEYSLTRYINVAVDELEYRLHTRLDSVEIFVSEVNSTIIARIDRLESITRTLIANTTRYLESSLAIVNTTLHRELERLNSLVINRTSELASIIDTVSKRMTETIDLTANRLMNFTSREITDLESRVIAKITAVNESMVTHLDRKTSELNESIRIVLRAYEERLKYVEEKVADAIRLIMETRSEIQSEIKRVQTEITTRYGEIGEQMKDIELRVNAAILASEEAKSASFTTMTISIATLLLVIVSLGATILTLLRLGKLRKTA